MTSRLLQAKAFPEQSYDACLGVLRLKKAVGAERLEAACAMALKGARVRYRLIKTILENNRDKLVQDEQAGRESTLPRHENIRGPLAFT
ncbi:MAG: hypothetical protein ACO4AU_16245 [bacterium]